MQNDLEKLRQHPEDLVSSRTQKLERAVENLLAENKRLKETNVELQKHDKLKSEFISMTAHELRTPLTSIREGTSQVLDRLLGEINPEQAEVLAIVLEEIDRLGRIISAILDISRIETGRIVLQRSVFVFSELVNNVVSKFDLASKQKDIKMGVEITPPFFRACADKDRLEQVLFNLIGNAFKFAPDGGKITVEAGLQKGYISCSVVDNGIGIPSADQSAVFDKFLHSARPTGAGAAGCGLGLAITKLLVELHGGEIHVESEPDRGTRFTFTFPDYASRESLHEYLDRRTTRPGDPDAPFALLGVRLANCQVLEEALREKFPLFIDKLTMVIGEEMDPRIPIWAWVKEGEWVGLLKGAHREAGRQRELEMRKGLEHYRFIRGGETIAFQMRVASAAFPEDAGDVSGVVDALRNNLDRQTAFQPSELKRRVLVVDNESTITDFVSDLLQSAGIEPLVAHDGIQAAQIAGEELPDLILLDMKLPGIDGYEVIARLKLGRATGNIPVIFFSGYPIDTSKLKEVAGHYVPTLEKPIGTGTLLKLIEETLSLKKISV